MKKYIFIASVLIIAGVSLPGCGKSCRGTECPNLNIPVFMFRIVNSASKDIMIGSAKVYDTAALKITAKNKQTGSLQTVAPNFYANGDTILLTTFTVSDKNSVYYLSLNNIVRDSMFFTYKYMVDECCDRSYYFMNKFNTTDLSTTITLPNPTSYNIIK